MIELCLIAIFIALCIALLGIGILFYTIKHIPKINKKSKYLYLIIILHWIVIVFGAWLTMESINAIYCILEFLHIILKL